MKKRSYTDEELINAVKISKSYSNVIRILGLKQAGGTQKNIKAHVERLKCDVSHFTGMLWSKGKTKLDDPRIGNAEDIFVQNSKSSKSYIRNLVIKTKVIEYKCQLCSNSGTWNNKALKLQLDHINGDPRDQRLENLRFLCPNCHTQTETYCASNIKYVSKQKITDEQIWNEFQKTGGNINKTLYNLGIENGRNYARVYKIISKRLGSPTAGDKRLKIDPVSVQIRP